MERLPTQESHPDYSALADRIDAFNATVHEGRGAEVLRWIAEDLRKGNSEAVKADCANQSDKIRQYPEVHALLKEAGLIEEIDFDND